MWTRDALEHYRTLTALGEAAGVTRQAAGAWGDVVPYWPAHALHEASEGAVPLHPEHYDRGRIVAPAAAQAPTQPPTEP